ncbi:MAG TPA: 6-phospho-beta-glucosidase [Bacilli bacterium]
MVEKQLKIAVIGGGSSYTPELIEGFIKRYPHLPVKDLYLVDIEEGRNKLEIVGALAKRMVEKAGVPIRIHLTLERREAIKDADFVITQLRVGLLEARVRDEKIPLRYNRIGQETTGAGGFANALRTIPVILEICKDIQELSPNAFMFNFTNPAGLVTEAVLKYSKVKSIGLCNLPIGTQMQIAKSAGVNRDDVELEMVGINHLNWTTKIMVKGEDITSFILQKAENTGFSMKNVPDFGWSPEFLRSLGALPCAYHRYYYMPDKMLAEEIESAKTVGTRAEVVRQIEAKLFEMYKNPELAVKPPELEKRGGAYYSEAALNLIDSIYNNKRDLQVVNVQNNGTISCLPDDVSIEAKCVIGAEGAVPVHITTPIDARIRGLLQIVKAYEELTVEAAVKGDYGLALQALAIHPLVGDIDISKRILDDVLSENKAYLPQFHL